jgi:methyltransferase (TIGR00027 family)
MDEERPSVTALGAAIMRALHQTRDHDPKVLDDRIVPQLVDPESEFYRMRVEFLKRLPLPTRLRFESTFVMRSRYAEDCLADAFDQDVRQYVILGAGLDTFAYRQPPWADSLRILEVDHPATQQWKRRCMAAASISIPLNVTLVPIDFARTSLAEGLSSAGLDFAAPAFFSMLGVSQYLSPEALELTLKYVLSMPSGTEIVFSFVASDAVLPADDVAFVNAIITQSAAVGEPWLSRFHPDELIAKLTEMGFSHVFHLTPEEANHRYFQNRRDGLNAALGEQMIRATI